MAQSAGAGADTATAGLKLLVSFYLYVPFVMMKLLIRDEVAMTKLLLQGSASLRCNGGGSYAREIFSRKPQERTGLCKLCAGA